METAFESIGGSALEISADAGLVQLSGESSPQLELWRDGSGRFGIGIDPILSARVGVADLSLEGIKAAASADIPVSLHGGPASAHLLLVRSGWTVGEPVWATARAEQLDLTAEATGIRLSDETLKLHGGATFTFRFGTRTRELTGRLGLGTTSAWDASVKPSAALSLRAVDDPGADLLAQLRVTGELTYRLRAGGRLRLMLECFERDLLGGAAAGRGLMFRLRL